MPIATSGREVKKPGLPVFTMTITELLRAAYAEPGLTRTAAELRQVLKQPITEETNARYLELHGHLVKALGYVDPDAHCRAYHNACCRYMDPAHADKYYCRYGHIVCNFCIPRHVHAGIIHPLEIDKL